MTYRVYYTLLVRDAPGEPWRIAFGDSELATVHDELDDYLDHDRERANLRIIRTGDTQVDIQAAVAILNRQGPAS